MSKTINAGTRVLLRVDCNAESRVPSVLPELRRLLRLKARVILATHLGRPGGMVVRKYSTASLAKALGVAHAKDVVGASAKALVASLAPGQAMLLENLRFEPGEEKNSKVFAKQLASLADVYVNNAFGVCHRAHASVSAITAYLPSMAGSLVQKEVAELTKPRRQPLVLVVGGIKLETKVPLLRKLGAEAEVILLGSGLYPVLAEANLPAAVTRKIVPMLDARHDARGRVIDIGPKTEKVFLAALRGAKTVLWNGPLGITERKDGAIATKVVAKAIAASSARTIVGGGETVDFLVAQGLVGAYSFVSTGGGAMLALLGGEPMPGLAALHDRAGRVV